ncbi:hypothetical protein, partial [Escherichia coli]
QQLKIKIDQKHPRKRVFFINSLCGLFSGRMECPTGILFFMAFQNLPANNISKIKGLVAINKIPSIFGKCY